MIRSNYYGAKADLYGIGLLFYEMITGVLPFVNLGGTNQEILDHISQNIPFIYREQYIKKNLLIIKKNNGNCIISQ